MNEMNELPDNTNDPSKGLPNDGGADLSKDTTPDPNEDNTPEAVPMPKDSTNDPSKDTTPAPNSGTEIAKTGQENLLAKIVPVAPVVGDDSFIVNNLPDASWTEEQLVQEVRTTLADLLGYHKKMAIDVVRFGAALAFLKEPLKKRREWTKFLGQSGISPTTAWRAIKVYEHATIENGVATLTINEVYKVLDLVPDAKAIEDDSVNVEAIEADGANANDSVRAIESDDESLDDVDEEAIESDAANDKGKVGPKKKGSAGKGKKPRKANKEPSKKAKGDADSAHKTKWRVYIDQKELRKKGSTEHIEAWPSIMSDDAEHFYGENATEESQPTDQWPYHILKRIRRQLEDILDDTMSIDWSKALVSPDEYIDMLSVIVFAAEGLMESFSQARETTAFEATVVEAAQHNVEIVEAESTIHDPLPPRVMEGFVVTKKVNGKLGLAKQLHDTHKWLVIAPDKHTAQLLNKDCIPKPVAEVAEAVKNDKSAGICFVTVTEDGTLVHEYRAWKTITSRPFTTDDDWDASAAKALSEKFAAVAPASEEAAIGHKPAAEDVPLPSRISNGFVAVREKDGKVGFKTEQHDGKCWLLIAESERDVMLAAKGAVVKPVAGFTESIGKRKVCDAGVCFVTAQNDDSLVREFIRWEDM